MSKAEAHHRVELLAGGNGEQMGRSGDDGEDVHHVLVVEDAVPARHLPGMGTKRRGGTTGIPTHHFEPDSRVSSDHARDAVTQHRPLSPARQAQA